MNLDEIVLFSSVCKYFSYCMCVLRCVCLSGGDTQTYSAKIGLQQFVGKGDD